MVDVQTLLDKNERNGGGIDPDLDIDRVYGTSELTPTEIDLLGGDLRIAPTHEIVKHNEERLARLERLATDNDLRPTDIDPWLARDVFYVKERQRELFTAQTEEHRTLALSLQELVIEELRRRESDRAAESIEAYPQGSKESYEENIAVLDELMIELTGDMNEAELSFEEELDAEKAIDYLQVWRSDMLAEIDAVRIRKLYSLVA